MLREREGSEKKAISVCPLSELGTGLIWFILQKGMGEMAKIKLTSYRGYSRKFGDIDQDLTGGMAVAKLRHLSLAGAVSPWIQSSSAMSNSLSPAS